MLDEAFRARLVDLDVAESFRLWRHVFPHLPPPENDEGMLTMLHMARTQTKSIPFRLRAYSHRWLIERDLPSHLPDHLKPRAERVYPRVVVGVGISYNYRDPLLKPAGVLIRTAMEGAVLEAEADGKLNDDPYVTARMHEARDKEKRALFGRLGLINIGSV
jgi:hypothetical protein